jgi:glycosyltransferase involved in cell wall biosynthesis
MSPLEQILSPVNGAPRAADKLMAVSIIVPALNEEKMIGRCLESLAALDFARERFEVIVVDNGSSDRTREISESFQDRLNLRVLEKRGVRISGLRNLGAREAQGSIVAFLDADCLAPKEWLERLIQLLPAEGAGIVGAHYLLPQESTWVGRTWHRYQEAEKSGEVSHVPAGDLVMRREDFLRIGGFDESIQTNEDYELCERARASGMTVRAVPEIGVVHLGTAQSLRVFFRKQAWHGTHVVKVFLRNISGSHNFKAVMFAAWTLFWFIAMVAAAAWAIVDRRVWWAPVVSIAALLAPALALAIKQVLRSKRFADFFPLAALYLAYGMARAKALVRLF